MNWLRQNWRPIVGLASLILPPLFLWIDIAYMSKRGDLFLIILLGGVVVATWATPGIRAKVLVSVGYSFAMAYWLFVLGATLVCGYHGSCP